MLNTLIVGASGYAGAELVTYILNSTCVFY